MVLRYCYLDLYRSFEYISISGEEFHSFAYNDPNRSKEVYINGVDIPDSDTQRMLESADKLNLVPVSVAFV